MLNWSHQWVGSWVTFLLLSLSTACARAPVQPEQKTLEAGFVGTELPFPETLQKNVEFWIRINSEFSTSQGVIHDSEDVTRIYETLDLKKAGKRGGARINLEKAKWRRTLLSVHQKQASPEKMTKEEKRVFEMFQDSRDPNRFLNAAHRKRIRFQRGQKEQFLSGYKQSGKYLRRMEEVFVQSGLPKELTRLPFVESSFNLKARSKVGASGIWQFMKSTGRLFLRVDDWVDERNDPIRASEAAAQLLKMNYRSLGNWPLAVTAYNHGRKALMRAVRRIGSDRIEDVIEGYNGRSFGFASRNFYPELLALIELERNASKYFGKIEKEPEMKFFEVKISHEVNLKKLNQTLGLESSVVRELNPGLSDPVLKGAVPIPVGYRLRLQRNSEESEEALTQRTLEKLGVWVKSVQGDSAPSLKM